MVFVFAFFFLFGIFFWLALASGFWLLAFGFWLLAFGSWLLASGFELLLAVASGFWLLLFLASGFELLASAAFGSAAILHEFSPLFAWTCCIFYISFFISSISFFIFVWMSCNST